MLTKILIGLVVLGVISTGAFYFLAQQSKSGTAIGLENGKLAACPSSPNCVVSEDHADDKHRVDAFAIGAWANVPDAVRATGGKITSQSDTYIAAEYSTKTLGFVDDVEFRLADDAVHVRSASRVGYSDRGLNAARVEALRAELGGA